MLGSSAEAWQPWEPCVLAMAFDDTILERYSGPALYKQYIRTCVPTDMVRPQKNLTTLFSALL